MALRWHFLLYLMFGSRMFLNLISQTNKKNTLSSLFLEREILSISLLLININLSEEEFSRLVPITGLFRLSHPKVRAFVYGKWWFSQHFFAGFCLRERMISSHRLRRISPEFSRIRLIIVSCGSLFDRFSSSASNWLFLAFVKGWVIFGLIFIIKDARFACRILGGFDRIDVDCNFQKRCSVRLGCRLN